MSDTAPHIGTVIGVHGQAWAESPEGMRPLEQDGVVHEGERIHTGPDSGVEIRFLDDTLLSQGADSTLSLDDYVFDSSRQHESNLDFGLLKGAFRHVSGKIAETNPENVRLESPLAVIGIRGTVTVHKVGDGQDGETHGVESISPGHRVIIQDGFGEIRIISLPMVKVELRPDGPMEFIQPLTPEEMEFFHSLSPGALELSGTPGSPEGGADGLAGGGVDPVQDGEGAPGGDDAGQQGQSGQQGEQDGQTPQDASEPGSSEDDGAESQDGQDAPPAPQSTFAVIPYEDQPGDAPAAGFYDGGGGDGGYEGSGLTPVAGSSLQSAPEALSAGSGPGSTSDEVFYFGEESDTPIVSPEPADLPNVSLQSPAYWEHMDSGGYPSYSWLPSGYQAVSGSEGDDVIQANVSPGGSGPFALFGFGGNDSLNAAANHIFYGGAGNDTVEAGAGDNTVHGGTGDDRIVLGDGDNSVDGGDGADTVITGSGVNAILGGTGDDTIVAAVAGHASNDAIDGGTGDDLLRLLAGTHVQNAFSSDAGLRDIESIWLFGASGVDLTGQSEGFDVAVEGSADIPVTIIGGAGNDLIGGGIDADSLLGGSGNDSIYGGLGNDILEGGSGNDELWGGDGDNTLQGGDGDDFLAGGDGEDSLSGDSGNDTIHGHEGADYIDGGAGNDVLYGAGDNDTLWGGVGNDFITGDDGHDSIDGGDDADTISGGAGNDTLLGGTGNDSIDGSEYDDSLDGGDGNDTLGGGDGEDFLDGGAGDDILDSGEGDDTLAGGDGTDTLIGGPGDDSVTGGLGGDRFRILAPDDLIGDEIDGTLEQGTFDRLALVAQSAGLTFDLTDAASIQHIDRIDIVSDVAGTKLVLGSGVAATADTNGDGTPGDIRVQFRGEGGSYLQPMINAVFIDGSGLTASQALHVEGENYNQNGFAGNDTILGGAGADTLEGGDGNDSIDGGQSADGIQGGSGNDTLVGGAGNDTVWGGAGVDSMAGGPGDDFFTFKAGDAAAGEIIDGGSDTDTIWMNESVDFRGAQILGVEYVSIQAGSTATFDADADQATWTVLGDDAGTGSETLRVVLGSGGEQVDLSGLGFANWSGSDLVSVQGGAGTDTILGAAVHNSIDGGAGDDVLETGPGNDTVLGGTGNDSLYGDAGADSLVGGDGTDTLEGASGADTLTGGVGSDIFVYWSADDSKTGEGVDTITDFSTGLDKIRLAGLSTESTFVYRGAGAFDGTDAQARLAGNTLLIDADGDGNEDMRILLNGVSSLDQSDFIWEPASGGSAPDDNPDNWKTVAVAQALGGGSFNFEWFTDQGFGILSGNELDNADLALSPGSERYAIFGFDGNDGIDASASDAGHYHFGGDGDDSITGGGSRDTIYGGAGGDSLLGGLGDDAIHGGAGNDVVIGGDGNDTAFYSGQMAGYEFGTDGAGRITVSDIDPAAVDEGMDVLEGIELAQFADGLVTLTPDGEFQVNTAVANDQWNSVISPLSDGGYVVAWASGDDGDGYGVFFQRFGADGSPAGAETRANSEFQDFQMNPTIASLPGGGFVIAWTSDHPGGTDTNIFARHFDVNGSPLGDDMQVNVVTDGWQSSPKIAVLSSGGYVISWESPDSDSTGIFARQFDADGSPVGAEFQVNTHTASDQYALSAVSLANGGFVIIWASGGQDGSGYGVYAQRYNADGSRAGVEFCVNTQVSGYQGEPDVAALAAGGFVAVWTSEAQDGSSYGVFGQRYNEDGSADGSEFRVNSHTDDGQYSPKIAGLAHGGFVVTWTSELQDGSGDGIYARLYDADGNTMGEEFLVNTTTVDSQVASTVASLSDGGFVITWKSENQDGSEGGIYAQRFGADGSRVHELSGDAGANTLAWSGSQGIRIVGGDDYDTLIGGSGNDYLDGGPGFDSVVGMGGDDLILGGDYDNDTLDGGSGQDTLDYWSESAPMSGNGLNITLPEPGEWGMASLFNGHADQIKDFEHLVGNAWKNEFLIGNSLDNSIRGGGGSLEGRDGNDTLVGSEDNQETLLGGQGSDVLYGLGQSDKLEGGDGADFLYGGNGSDTLYGGTGDDWIEGGEGDDRLYDGNETVGAGAGNDSLLGGEGNDILYAFDGANRLDGGEGDDELNGGHDSDTLDGGLGADYLAGGDGDDVLDGGPGNDTISGGEGNDEIWGSQDADTIDGGGGNNTVDYFYSNAAVDVDLREASPSGGWAEGDVLSGIHNLYGSWSGNDTLVGTEGDNFIGGSAGDDSIDALGGNDWVEGGQGVDTVQGGDGNDWIQGDGGTADPGDGGDQLYGGAGGDTILGGGGDDWITGGLGADSLTGGDGADLFIYGSIEDSNATDGTDLINDFTSGVDMLRFDGLLTGTFSYLGDLDFGNSGHSQARLQVGGDSVLEIDVDGSGSADMHITMANISDAGSLDVDDFSWS